MITKKPPQKHFEESHQISFGQSKINMAKMSEVIILSFNHTKYQTISSIMNDGD